jgi:hypothetical protein
VENIVATNDELHKSSVEVDSVSQAAKETQNYAKALKLRITSIKGKSILVSNYKTKKVT